MTRFFFFLQIFSLSGVKTNSDRRKVSKNLKLGFSGSKALLFCLKGVPWTGNELASNDVENFEITNLSYLL